jgi:hypothetical protein
VGAVESDHAVLAARKSHFQSHLLGKTANLWKLEDALRCWGRTVADYRGKKLRKSCKKLCGSLIDLQRVDAEPETEAVMHLVHDTARE